MQGAPFDPISLGSISTAAAAAGRGLCIRLRRSILDSVQLASTVETAGSRLLRSSRDNHDDAAQQRQNTTVPRARREAEIELTPSPGAPSASIVRSRYLRYQYPRLPSEGFNELCDTSGSKPCRLMQPNENIEYHRTEYGSSKDAPSRQHAASGRYRSQICADEEDEMEKKAANLEELLVCRVEFRSVGALSAFWNASRACAGTPPLTPAASSTQVYYNSSLHYSSPLTLRMAVSRERGPEAGNATTSLAKKTGHPGERG
ncbi:hypothetical protein CSOJ01_07928 [Colletotrichum sojae]|uniref:Uncharacterized protein n=1 Tax=Colletotrichum sojae TaxID=2175907 RepID=A0A8H6J806_9PEZI|nr:hypothetical protein CSOJ01_07928 [Colletotrichum sojae]